MRLYENNTCNKAKPFLTLGGYIDQVYVATINLYGNHVNYPIVGNKGATYNNHVNNISCHYKDMKVSYATVM